MQSPHSAPRPTLARYLALAPGLAALFLIPWSHDLAYVAQSFNAALVFALALIGPPIVILAAQSLHHAPDAPLNSLRLALRQLSYQLPLALAVLLPVMAAGSLNLATIAAGQSENFLHWLIFHDPFTLLAFLVSMAAIQGLLHETSPNSSHPFQKNKPHNLLFFLCALQATLFLGGWYDPINLVAYLEKISHPSTEITRWNLALLANATAVAVLFMKVLALVKLQQFFMKNLPRYRFPEVFTLSSKILIPAAIFNLVAAAAYFWLVEPLPALQHAVQTALAILFCTTALVFAFLILYARRSNLRSLSDVKIPAGDSSALSVDSRLV